METGATWPQAKEHLEPQELGQTRKDPPTEPPEGAPASLHLDFSLLPSRTGRQRSSVLLTARHVVTCLVASESEHPARCTGGETEGACHPAPIVWKCWLRCTRVALPRDHRALRHSDREARAAPIAQLGPGTRDAGLSDLESVAALRGDRLPSAATAAARPVTLARKASALPQPVSHIRPAAG